MSYICEICNLLMSKGVISREQFDVVIRFVAPQCIYVHNKEEEFHEEYEGPDERYEEEMAANEQELLEDRQEIQANAKAQHRRSGGGRNKERKGRWAIKAPKLNELVSERVIKEYSYFDVFAMLEQGTPSSSEPDWPKWSQCVGRLYEASDKALGEKLSRLLNRSVTRDCLPTTTAKLLALYDESFFDKRLLDDVSGPSVSTFLNAMQNNFDMEFTYGQRDSWLYDGTPNIVVMRKALIVRNRLRTSFTDILRKLDGILVDYLDGKCLALKQLKWADVLESDLPLDVFLPSFLESPDFSRQEIIDLLGNASEPYDVFSKKLVHQWILMSIGMR